jgi:CheY-like chemotaxis protein/HPt (histidine-containing phosphotransfer) domain-containing protein
MPVDAVTAAAVAERMRPLRVLYFESLRERMQVIERALVLLVSHELHQPQDRLALRNEAHKLAGTGATYGFPAISDAGKALESALVRDDAGHEQLLALVAELLHVCHEALGEHALAKAPAVPLFVPVEMVVAARPAILVADDDEAVRELVSHKLTQAGYDVVCAADGAQAWHALQTRSFELAVLDLMMPGLDGMSLLRMMQSHPDMACTPVVILSARDLSSDVLAGLDTGAADYITKPFNSDELVSRCRRLLRSPAREPAPLAATRRRDESTVDC